MKFPIDPFGYNTPTFTTTPFVTTNTRTFTTIIPTTTIISNTSSTFPDTTINTLDPILPSFTTVRQTVPKWYYLDVCKAERKIHFHLHFHLIGKKLLLLKEMC